MSMLLETREQEVAGMSLLSWRGQGKNGAFEAMGKGICHA